VGLLGRLVALVKGGAAGAAANRGANVWEDEAARRLETEGYRILARNVRTRRSDLDIVALDGCDVVFVEVKARASDDFGGPAEAVDRNKRRRLVSAAKETIVREGWHDRPCRFDVVLIWIDTEPLRVEHIVNAFGEGE
jgi:putative endonuclease